MPYTGSLVSLFVICSKVDIKVRHEAGFYTGKERDTESGNDYFGARYYGSSMGRFSSPDSSGLYFADQTNPQSLNLYSYVQNNPLINTDPTGLECVWDDGSYDSNDDSSTGDGAVDKHGNHTGCSGQGGTWVDHSYFASNNMADWSSQANQTLADMTVPTVTVTTTPDNSITLDISPDIWNRAAKQVIPVKSFPWSYGNWAGRYGMGAPIDDADAGAMVHDDCYSQGRVTPGTNFAGHSATAQACNQALCDTESVIAAKLDKKLSSQQRPWSGNPVGNEQWYRDNEEEGAAAEMVTYFVHMPFGNACRVSK